MPYIVIEVDREVEDMPDDLKKELQEEIEKVLGLNDLAVQKLHFKDLITDLEQS